jgi:hypothetical protein
MLQSLVVACTVVVAACQSEPSARRTEAPARAESCVDPVEYTRTSEGAANARIELAVDVDTPDFDHDGNADAVVEFEHAGKRALYLFVRRGGCGQFVGKVPDADLVEAQTTRSHGLADLLTIRLCIAGRSEKRVWTYVFDGTQYRLVSERPPEACPKESAPGR